MSIDYVKAMMAAAKEGGAELIDRVADHVAISTLGAILRGFRDSITEQKAEEFAGQLSVKEKEIENNLEWYKTEDGTQFVEQIVATALNAEYADKIDFLVNAFVNGPTLCNEKALQQKFVQFIRQLSRPALEVLVAALDTPVGNEIDVGSLAHKLNWDAELTDACVSELHSLGAFSSTLAWSKDASGNGYHKTQFFTGHAAGMTEFTKKFAEFVSSS